MKKDRKRKAGLSKRSPQTKAAEIKTKTQQ